MHFSDNVETHSQMQKKSMKGTLIMPPSNTTVISIINSSFYTQLSHQPQPTKLPVEPDNLLGEL